MERVSYKTNEERCPVDGNIGVCSWQVRKERTIALIIAIAANDAITTSSGSTTNPIASPQNEGVLTAVNKLTTLVEGHPRLSIHCIGFITN